MRLKLEWRGKEDILGAKRLIVKEVYKWGMKGFKLCISRDCVRFT